MSDAIDGAIEQLQRMQHRLIEIRGVLVARLEPGQSDSADREAYHDTLIRFQQWCEKRRLSFPLTMSELMKRVMRETTVDLETAIDRLDAERNQLVVSVGARTDGRRRRGRPRKGRKSDERTPTNQLDPARGAVEPAQA